MQVKIRDYQQAYNDKSLFLSTLYRIDWHYRIVKPQPHHFQIRLVKDRKSEKERESDQFGKLSRNSLTTNIEECKILLG
ncbi:hypothetical protein KTT_11660 [Tengunoibacter tsumagoiensis]|uniref:Uncharacterized protein n=1 Tax=Tengunoibacter tsumagoiensis TaxID=2014871 RepID=A0A401ZWR8_9CHLR|nr:hypothetical protein KTT_11660 [Tengunoibacter tsumagoiensis]